MVDQWDSTLKTGYSLDFPLFSPINHDHFVPGKLFVPLLYVVTLLSNPNTLSGVDICSPFKCNGQSEIQSLNPKKKMSILDIMMANGRKGNYISSHVSCFQLVVVTQLAVWRRVLKLGISDQQERL